MNEHETFADIAQKIRDAGFDELSDHIMAAHKREVREAVTGSNQLREALDKARRFINSSPLVSIMDNKGTIARDELCAEIDAAIAEPATAEKTSAVGDAAKLRKALEYVQEKLYVDCNGEVYICANEVKRISDKINAALATPARNCDKVKDHSDAIEKFEKWMDFSPKTADEQDAFFKEHWFEFAMWLIDMNESEAEK